MSALCKINEAQLYLELMLSCSRALQVLTWRRIHYFIFFTPLLAL